MGMHFTTTACIVVIIHHDLVWIVPIRVIVSCCRCLSDRVVRWVVIVHGADLLHAPVVVVPEGLARVRSFQGLAGAFQLGEVPHVACSDARVPVHSVRVVNTLVALEIIQVRIKREVCRELSLGCAQKSQCDQLRIHLYF